MAKIKVLSVKYNGVEFQPDKNGDPTLAELFAGEHAQGKNLSVKAKDDKSKVLNVYAKGKPTDVITVTLSFEVSSLLDNINHVSQERQSASEAGELPGLTPDRPATS